MSVTIYHCLHQLLPSPPCKVLRASCLSCSTHGHFWLEGLFFFFNLFIYFNWKLITLQYCSGFCHTMTWISPGCTCVPHDLSILLLSQQLHAGAENGIPLPRDSCSSSLASSHSFPSLLLCPTSLARRIASPTWEKPSFFLFLTKPFYLLHPHS